MFDMTDEEVAAIEAENERLKVLTEILPDYELGGFDPDVMMHSKASLRSNGSSVSINIPMVVANKLLEQYATIKKLMKVAGRPAY